MELLRPFILTSVNSGSSDLAGVEPAAREVFRNSKLSKDPQRLNIFMFVLSSQGNVVHEFHGLPGGTRGNGAGRSNHKVELEAARAKLKLPDNFPRHAAALLPGLPDIKADDSRVPAGVRVFLRQNDLANSHSSKAPIVEVVPMHADDWKALSFAPEGREIDAAVLKNWLIHMYPAGIRTADERKPFQKITGTLKLEPAGSDGTFRHGLLRGLVRLEKGDATESAFEGELQAIVTYRLGAPDVHSVRAVVSGDYLYRIRGVTNPQKLRAAIESRPE